MNNFSIEELTKSHYRILVSELLHLLSSAIENLCHLYKDLTYLFFWWTYSLKKISRKAKFIRNSHPSSMKKALHVNLLTVLTVYTLERLLDSDSTSGRGFPKLFLSQFLTTPQQSSSVLNNSWQAFFRNLNDLKIIIKKLFQLIDTVIHYIM